MIITAYTRRFSDEILLVADTRIPGLTMADDCHPAISVNRHDISMNFDTVVSVSDSRWTELEALTPREFGLYRRGLGGRDALETRLYRISP